MILQNLSGAGRSSSKKERSRLNEDHVTRGGRTVVARVTTRNRENLANAMYVAQADTVIKQIRTSSRILLGLQ